jgi:hypothetical protein
LASSYILWSIQKKIMVFFRSNNIFFKYINDNNIFIIIIIIFIFKFTLQIKSMVVFQY